MTSVSNFMNGILFVGRDGDIRLINTVAEDLLGSTSVLALGKRMDEIAGCRELIEGLAADHDVVRDRKESFRTVEIHHTEQDLLYIKSHTTKVIDANGAFAGILTVLQNVTEDYKTDQLKNQYLSIVAHELRTPLTGIKTFSTMMAKGTLGPLNDKQQRVMESIREQSLRLEHQIDKLINLGHLDSEEYVQDLEEFDVGEFLTSAAAPFEQAAKDRGVRLSTTVPAGVRLRADRADLKRTLQALIENAIKFTPEEGSVRVTAGAEGDRVRFTVQDTGIGIDPRYHRRIFEKFFQVEDPLTRQHGGAGLGLFVAHGIVEAHGSHIDVQSELGQGASFSFALATCANEPVPAEDGGVRGDARAEVVAT